MLIKDFYVPLEQQGLTALQLDLVKAKYDDRHKGILFLIQETVLSHFPISNEQVLRKSLDYYSKQQNTKVTWCYGKEAKDN